MIDAPDCRSLRRQIADDRLILRALTISDLDAMYAAVMKSQAELIPWISWCTAEYSQADTRRFLSEQPEHWTRGEVCAFGIADALDGEFCGGVGINAIDRRNRTANLGYWIRSDRTRRGLASRATCLLARATLQDLDFERIEIVAALGNLASQRAAEKSGATREGILRQRLRTPQGQADAVCYSLVRADFGLPPAGA